MKEIGKGKDLLSKLSGENSILDASVKRISIFDEDDALKIELVLNMRSSSEYGSILICFEDVIEYGFYYTQEHIFYNIEQYKFFYNPKSGYYISLDPIDEVNELSEEDQDFILSKDVIAFAL